MNPLIGAGLIGVAGNLGSSVASAISNAVSNKQNIAAQKEINAANIASQEKINAANIKSAMDQQKLARDYALEDREYESEISQYQRLINTGLSPAAARAALNQGQSNLLGSIQSMPVQQAAMQQAASVTPYQDTGLAGAGSVMSGAIQMREQLQQQSQLAENQLNFEKQKHNEELIFEEFGRNEVNQQNPIVQEFWRDLIEYCQSQGAPLEGQTREDIENWLEGKGSDVSLRLLQRMNQLAGNACADALLNNKFDKYALSKEKDATIGSIVSQTNLTKANKLLTEKNINKAEIELKHYPTLMSLEVQYKKLLNNMTIEQINELVQSNEFQSATREQRLQMLGIELDLQTFDKEMREFQNSNKKTDYWFDKASQIVQAVSAGVGIYAGLGVGSAARQGVGFGAKAAQQAARSASNRANSIRPESIYSEGNKFTFNSTF